MVLDKKTTLFERDEKGQLIPQEVELVIDENNEAQTEYKGQTVYLIPMTRGEIRKMLSELSMKDTSAEKDNDGELILKYCKKPQYTEEEIPYIKKDLASILINTIFEYSGLVAKNKTRKKAIEDKEDDFGKN